MWGTDNLMAFDSSIARTSNTCSRSGSEMRVTTAPLLRWNSTSPSASSRFSASRTGILLTLNMRATSSCRMGSPSSSVPSMMAALT